MSKHDEYSLHTTDKQMDLLWEKAHGKSKNPQVPREALMNLLMDMTNLVDATWIKVMTK